MRRLSPLVVGTVVVLGACSDRTPPPVVDTPAASSQGASTPSQGPSAAAEAPARPSSPAAVRSVQVFFSSDPAACDAVAPVPRDVPASAPLRPALEQLFAGPTAREEASGLTGDAVPGLLRGARVVERRVYVDLVGDLLPGSATASCGGAAFTARLTATVRGIVAGAQVVVALDGDPERFVTAQQGVCEEPPTLGDRCDASGFSPARPG